MSPDAADHAEPQPARGLCMSGYAGEDFRARNDLSRFAMLEKPTAASVMLHTTHGVPGEQV
jgi:hypothetical protein